MVENLMAGLLVAAIVGLVEWCRREVDAAPTLADKGRVLVRRGMQVVAVGCAVFTIAYLGLEESPLLVLGVTTQGVFLAAGSRLDDPARPTNRDRVALVGAVVSTLVVAIFGGDAGTRNPVAVSLMTAGSVVTALGVLAIAALPRTMALGVRLGAVLVAGIGIALLALSDAVWAGTDLNVHSMLGAAGLVACFGSGALAAGCIMRFRAGGEALDDPAVVTPRTSPDEPTSFLGMVNA